MCFANSQVSQTNDSNLQVLKIQDKVSREQKWGDDLIVDGGGSLVSYQTEKYLLWGLDRVP